MTSAKTRLSLWLTASDLAPVHIAPLWGDVSRRRYFHVTFEDDTTAVAVDYPRDMRPVCARFLATTALLQAGRVRVPEILLSACDLGLMLVEDLGSKSLYDIAGREWHELEPFYAEALAYINSIQQLPTNIIADLNPPLDGALLRQEIEVSWDSLFEQNAVPTPPVLLRQLRSALAELLDHLKECPLVPCHRDFMARNLMLCASEPHLAVIDHQDLRLGPAFYDLASLLNDSLFPPPTLETTLCESSIDSEDELLLYHRCSVQRTVKAAGTFVRFAEQGDRRHLSLVNPTLRQAASHLQHLPEGGSFADSLAAHWDSALPTSS